MTKQFLSLKINKHLLVLSLLLYSSVFVNTAIVSDTKILIFYLMLVFGLLIYNKDFLTYKIDDNDKIFLFFLFVLLLNQIIVFGIEFHIKTLTQLINFYLIFFIFVIVKFVVNKSYYNKEYLLIKYFKYNTLLIFISIILYVYGLSNPDFIYKTVHTISNSSIFDTTNIIALFGEWGPARLNVFMPEPSFMGFLIAINIAVALNLKERFNFYLLINFIGLVLTVSRTGFLILVAIIIYKYFFKNIYTKGFIILIGIPIFIYFITEISFIDIDLSFKQRFESIYYSFLSISNNPITGIGFGSYEIFAIQNNLESRDVFNLYLYIIVSGGVLSLIVFLIMLVKFYYSSEYKIILISIIIGWMTMSAYNLTFIWFLLGVIMAKKGIR